MHSRELGNLMSSARQYQHDLEQARRRTHEQNEEIIHLIEHHGAHQVWYYDDVPEDGGPVTLGVVGGPKWRIDGDGAVEVIRGQ